MINSRLSPLIPESNVLSNEVRHIIAICFLAPTLWVNCWLCYTAFVYQLIGFTPDRVTYWSVVGCFTKTWMYPVTYFTNQLYLLTCVVAGFLFSRKGSQQKSFFWVLTGAFALYPIVDRFIWSLSHIKSNPLWFLDRKATFEKQLLPVFNNFYTFKWASFWIDNVITLLLIFVVYKVMFQYWNKDFRRQMLSWGAVASIAGWVVWYLLAGPILY